MIFFASRKNSLSGSYYSDFSIHPSDRRIACWVLKAARLDEESLNALKLFTNLAQFLGCRQVTLERRTFEFAA